MTIYSTRFTAGGDDLAHQRTGVKVVQTSGNCCSAVDRTAGEVVGTPGSSMSFALPRSALKSDGGGLLSCANASSFASSLRAPSTAAPSDAGGSSSYRHGHSAEEFGAVLQRCREWQEAHSLSQQRGAELEDLLLAADKRRATAERRAGEVRCCCCCCCCDHRATAPRRA